MLTKDKVPSSFIGTGTFVPSAANAPSAAVLTALFNSYGVAGARNPLGSNLGFNNDGTLFTQTGALNYKGSNGTNGYLVTGGNVRIPLLKAALAEAEASVGHADTALRLIDECREQIDRPASQERLWLPEVLRIQGQVLAQQGLQARAEAALHAAIECAREQQAKSWELRAGLSLARMLAQRGCTDAARDLLAPIYGWFTEGADTPDLAEARALLIEHQG